MARPIAFKETTGLLFNGALNSDGDIEDLPVYQNNIIVVSCWRLTEDERAYIAAGGDIYVSVMTEELLSPPLQVLAENPFELPQEEDDV